MSQIYPKSSGKNISRAVSSEQYPSVDPLKDHHAFLNAKLPSFVDEINKFENQLISSNIEKLIKNSHKQLEQWRSDCYQLIDQIYENKLQEIDQRFRIKLDHSHHELSHLRLKLHEFTHQQQATYSDINQLTSQIYHFQEKINHIEKISFHLNISPLKLDNSLIQIKQSLSLPILSSPFQTFSYQHEYSSELASSNQYLLIEKHSSLYLIDQQLNIINQILWTHDSIRSICWSLTLSRFILITSVGNIFSLNPESMSIELLQTIPEKVLWSCTCSKQCLYLSFDERGSSIFEYSLFPSMEYIQKWTSPDTCTEEEFIYDICYNRKRLLLMIANGLHKTIRMDLKSLRTFQCLWSLQLDIDFRYHAFRCCLFNGNEWLVNDWYGSRLLHITKDLKIKDIQMYQEKPWRACVFSTNTLVITTMNSFHFHVLTVDGWIDSYTHFLYRSKWEFQNTRNLQFT